MSATANLHERCLCPVGRDLAWGRATEEVQRLVATCDDSLIGLRDRALLLVAFAGALRRSELCGIEGEHLTWRPRSIELLIPRSKTDAEGDGARIGIPRGKVGATCPVRALRAWLDATWIEHGPVFRAVTRHNTMRSAALSGEAVRLIVLKRAPGRDQGQPARADLAARAAGRVRHLGLPGQHP